MGANGKHTYTQRAAFAALHSPEVEAAAEACEAALRGPVAGQRHPLHRPLQRPHGKGFVGVGIAHVLRALGHHGMQLQQETGAVKFSAKPNEASDARETNETRLS